MIDRQSFFNKTVNHLHQQGAPAYEGGCRYRQYLLDGTVRSCAIGCHIPDELYSEQMEGKGVFHSNVYTALGFKNDRDSDLTFLSRLQYCHDQFADFPVEIWKENCEKKLEKFAGEYNLEFTSRLSSCN